MNNRNNKENNMIKKNNILEGKVKKQILKIFILSGIIQIFALSPALALKSSLTKKDKERLSESFLEEINNENFPQIIESFDYKDAEIQEVVFAISKLTGKNFILEPNVKGRITIITPSKITVAEAYRAFLSALAYNNLTIVPSGKYLKIRKVRDAKKDSLEIYSGKYFPNVDQMITRVVRLKHINATQLTKSVRPLIPRTGDIKAFESVNSIIITDYGSNIERIMKIIEELDIPGFEEKLYVIAIKNAKATNIAQMISKITESKNSTSKNRRSRVSRSSRFTSKTSNKSKASWSLVLPDERTNSIIVVGNKDGVTKIKKLVKQLDTELEIEKQGGPYVYYVHHGNAKDIAKILTNLNKTSPSSKKTSRKRSSNPLLSQGESLFEKDLKVIADENTNSLIITAGFQDYRLIKKVLSKIDVPKDQVLVKAIIMEVNEQDTFNWDVNIINFQENDPLGLGSARFITGNLRTLFSPIERLGSAGIALGFGSDNQVSIQIGERATQVPAVVGFINFLKQNTKSRILASPQIHATDNEEAEIESGRTIPVSSSRTAGTNGAADIVTQDRKDITLKLTLTPFINKASNTVRMKINQEIKDYNEEAGGPDISKGVITTLQRIKTNVVVKNGETAILGGLIRTRKSTISTKFPLLGDIPILGWLFKGHSNAVSNENLLIFITPTIIESDNHMNSLASKAWNDNKGSLKNIHHKSLQKFIDLMEQVPAFPDTDLPSDESLLIDKGSAKQKDKELNDSALWKDLKDNSYESDEELEDEFDDELLPQLLENSEEKKTPSEEPKYEEDFE